MKTHHATSFCPSAASPQDGNEEQIHKIVDTTNDQGWTPLHYACEHGHVDMLKVLLQYQADPKRTIASGAGALALACR